MRIGILETGHPSKDLNAPSYPAMIRTALGPRYTYRDVDVINGNLPGPESAVDGYIITGSESSAYDGDPWIARFREWLRVLDPAIPLVGICFGHQIMATAYGGVVEKSSKGWAIGLHEYGVRFREKWMDGESTFALPVFHYDQVVKLPSASQLVATSDFCPNAALSYTDRRAVSFQAHPEFTRPFVATLLEKGEREGAIEGRQADRAKESMQLPDDCSRIAGWIQRFLEAT